MNPGARALFQTTHDTNEPSAKCELRERAAQTPIWIEGRCTFSIAMLQLSEPKHRCRGIRNPPPCTVAVRLPFCPSQLEPWVRLLACEVGVGARGQKLRFRRVVASTSVSMKSVAPLARLCARTVRARVAAPCVVSRHPAPGIGWNGNITVMTTRASGVSSPTTTRWCSTNDGGSGILVTATDEQLEVYPPSDETRARANISSEEEYKRLWQLSVGTC